MSKSGNLEKGKFWPNVLGHLLHFAPLLPSCTSVASLRTQAEEGTQCELEGLHRAVGISAGQCGHTCVQNLETKASPASVTCAGIL